MRHMVIKRSVRIHGRKTSISLEEEFWQYLKCMARAKGMSMSAFLATIDTPERKNRNLSSTLRLHVFHLLQQQAAENRQCSMTDAGITIQRSTPS